MKTLHENVAILHCKAVKKVFSPLSSIIAGNNSDGQTIHPLPKNSATIAYPELSYQSFYSEGYSLTSLFVPKVGTGGLGFDIRILGQSKPLDSSLFEHQLSILASKTDALFKY
jgi:hypothetical protein